MRNEDSENRLRVGIVGTGSIADLAHAPALAASRYAVLRSVMSRDADRGRDFADRHGATATQGAFGDLGNFLDDDDLDAVIVATPDRFHFEHAKAALLAGKHVLCEKPLVTSVEQGRELIDLAADKDLRLATAFHLRWHNGHRLARRYLTGGALGQLKHIRLHWTFRGDPKNWRADPERGRWWALASNGPHLIDLALWLLPNAGEIVERQSLISRAHYGGPHDESALCALRFADGTTVEICTSILFDSQSRIEVHAEEGSFIAEGTCGRHGGGRCEMKNEPLDFEVRSPFIGLIDNFAQAIQYGRAPEVDGEGGLAVVRELLALCP